MKTRKRRLIEEAEAGVAQSSALYWEMHGVEADWERDDEDLKKGRPRRSRRAMVARLRAQGLAEGRQRSVLVGVGAQGGGGATGLSQSLPPLLSVKEGKLLAPEVFGEFVMGILPADDKGPRLGHCSSGFVCGYPTAKGKEGNGWCQTPVRSSLKGKLSCTHHVQRRVPSPSPNPNPNPNPVRLTREQRRYMLLAEEFYDQDGDLCWPVLVSHLEAHPPPSEVRKRNEVLVVGDEAMAIQDVKIVVHGYRQCVLFWMAVCRLARRGYAFSTVILESKAKFKALLADMRKDVGGPMSRTYSPLIFVGNAETNTRYYVGGYSQVCDIF